MKKVFKLPNTAGRKQPDKTVQVLTNIALVKKKDNLKVELRTIEQSHGLNSWRSGLFPGLMEFSRRRQWHPTPVLLPRESQGWWSLVGCSPWGLLRSDTTEQLHFHFSLSCIGEEMATHSSVLAWRIQGMGEPGGLLSMGSHRVGHD